MKQATFEMALAELRRVSARRRNTEAGAKLYQLFGEGCSGECEQPKPICGALGYVITCCTAYTLNEMHEMSKRIESDLRARIDRGNYEMIPDRSSNPSQLTIGEAYKRTFTGTSRLRTLKIKDEK